MQVNDDCVTGTLVPLYYPCAPGDICADQNSACIGGQCTCKPQYYDDSNVCGTSLL